MKISFVVHRYAPYPGGSEYYVQQMAEECNKRGHDVIVVTGEHKGNLNGVHVTSETIALLNRDLIVVHGGDVGVQNFVLQNANKINSPILYLIIKPSESPICISALRDCAYIGCSATEDWDHVRKWKVDNKSYQVRHGISPKDCTGITGSFKQKYNIPLDKKMFLSCGGYWPNKNMIELANTFNSLNIQDAILVTTGYDNRHNIMPHMTDKVIPLMVDDPKDVKNAIADAYCYIMNSSTEGFGLVILESMFNKTPWISRNIAGAKLLSDYGTVYDTQDELKSHILNFKYDKSKINNAYQYVIENHMISNTVDDILNIINRV